MTSKDINCYTVCMKLLITGGHFSPAMAIIEALQKKKPDVQIVFVGRKHSLEGEKTSSLEYGEIQKKGVRFIPLETGRLTRLFRLKSFASFIKIPLGFFQTFQILLREKPDRILSFGGYIALPIALIGAIFRIPVYTHEQTTRPGLSNRIIGFFAKKVFISFPESGQYFNSKKTILTGNPIRSSIYTVLKKPFTAPSDKPTLYITGGSLGSHSINMHIERILPDLLKNYTVIHQIGDTKEYCDYERLFALRERLPENMKNRYFIAKHFFDDEIGYIYSVSDIVIGRSGANTFFELLSLKKPAIFIPLPWSANKEQYIQAELFKNAGAGEIFQQSESGGKLEKIIEEVVHNKSSYQENFKTLQVLYKDNASNILIEEIFEK